MVQQEKCKSFCLLNILPSRLALIVFGKPIHFVFLLPSTCHEGLFDNLLICHVFLVCFWLNQLLHVAKGQLSRLQQQLVLQVPT